MSQWGCPGLPGVEHGTGIPQSHKHYVPHFFETRAENLVGIPASSLLTPFHGDGMRDT
jgi:hypothetical protein